MRRIVLRLNDHPVFHVTCWQCGADAGGLNCGDCGTLQPPDPRLDHFARLGLAPRFEQDADAIAVSHRALQRQVHPDRFTQKSPRERRLSLEHATSLNDAVRALRDPRRRADYLLKLRGADLDAEGEGRVQVDPLFLMEMLELREAMAELEGPDAHTERGRLTRQVVARYESTLAGLGRGLDEGAPLGPLTQAAAELRYLRRVIDELETLDQ